MFCTDGSSKNLVSPVSNLSFRPPPVVPPPPPPPPAAPPPPPPPAPGAAVVVVVVVGAAVVVVVVVGGAVVVSVITLSATFVVVLLVCVGFTPVESGIDSNLVTELYPVFSKDCKTADGLYSPVASLNIKLYTFLGNLSILYSTESFNLFSIINPNYELEINSSKSIVDDICCP